MVILIQSLQDTLKRLKISNTIIFYFIIMQKNFGL